MAKTAWIFSYKLRKNVTKEEFIECTQKLQGKGVSLVGALSTGSNMDGFCPLGDRRGRKECHNGRAGKGSHRKILCLHPDADL